MKFLYEFSKMLKWLSNNFLKLLVMTFLIIIIFILIALMIPFLHFLDFFYETISNFYDFFEELEKIFDDLKWDSIIPDKKDEV